MAKQSALIDGVKEIIQDSAFTSARILDYLNQGIRQIAGGVMIRYPDGTQVFSSPLPLLSTVSSLTTSTSLAYIDLPSDFGRNLYVLVSSTNEVQITIEPSFAHFMMMYPNLDSTNQVVCACIRGRLLFYQGYPSTAETLVPYYYRTPYDMATLTGATDISFTATTNVITDAGTDLDRFHVGQTIDVTGTTKNNTSLTVTAVATTGATLTVSEDLTTEANTSATIKSRPDGIPVHLHESLLENFAAWKIFERKISKAGEGDMNTKEEAARYHGLFLGSMINLESSIEDLPESAQIQSTGVSSWGYGRSF